MPRIKKELTEREIGFTQGIAFAAALTARYDTDAELILEASGIPAKDFRDHADDSDLEYIKKALRTLQKTK